MMERTDNSPLQQTPEAINVLCVDVAAHVLAFTVVDGFVKEALLSQFAISSMFVCRNQVNFVRDRLFHKLAQGLLVYLLNDLSDYVAFTSNRTDHRNLPGCTAPLYFFIQMPVFVLPAYVSFIYLYLAHELLKLLIRHGGAPAVTHIPTGAVVRAGLFAKDHAMNLQGAYALLRHQDQIPDFEPQLQGNLGILEDGVRNDAEAVAVLSSARCILTNPMVGSGFEGIDFLAVLTPGAGHALWPAQVHEKLLTGFVVWELPIEGIYGLHDSYIAHFCMGVN